jgi:protein gp37
MSVGTGIEWTEATWNPVTGCDRVSEGCDHCYALTLAARLKAMGNPRYQLDGDPRRSGPGFGVTLHTDKLKEPLRWRRSRVVFVNSMSDLFHDEVTDDFVWDVFATMAATPQHTYQVLTKRPGRMASVLGRWQIDGLLDPLPNVWLGTSVENQRWADVRIPNLLATPAAVRFLSCEPLLGPIALGAWVTELDWVIAGGESGSGHRPMDPDWVRSLRDQCLGADAAFFFKQRGGRTPKARGRELDGRTWDGMPGSGGLVPLGFISP